MFKSRRTVPDRQEPADQHRQQPAGSRSDRRGRLAAQRRHGQHHGVVGPRDHSADPGLRQDHVQHRHESRNPVRRLHPAGRYVPSDVGAARQSASSIRTISRATTRKSAVAAAFRSCSTAPTSLSTTVGGTDFPRTERLGQDRRRSRAHGLRRKMFPIANVAISGDDPLGAAMVAGINSKADAQAAYDAFAPDLSGGDARRRDLAHRPGDRRRRRASAPLRLFGKSAGRTDAVGQRVRRVHEHARPDQDRRRRRHVAGRHRLRGHLSGGDAHGFKDHGFGFSLGLDGGAPETGWYGARVHLLHRRRRRGRRSRQLQDRRRSGTCSPATPTGAAAACSSIRQCHVGYGQLKGKRFIDLAIPITGAITTFSREADSKRAALVACARRDDGRHDEIRSSRRSRRRSRSTACRCARRATRKSTAARGFNLTVKPYYANSLRIFLGSEFREDINVGDFFLQPSARLGYRFDLLNDPTKLRPRSPISIRTDAATSPARRSRSRDPIRAAATTSAASTSTRRPTTGPSA